MFECRWKKNEYNCKLDVEDEFHIEETQKEINKWTKLRKLNIFHWIIISITKMKKNDLFKLK